MGGGYNVICDIICVYVFFEGMDFPIRDKVRVAKYGNPAGYLKNAGADIWKNQTIKSAL